MMWKLNTKKGTEKTRKPVKNHQSLIYHTIYPSHVRAKLIQTSVLYFERQRPDKMFCVLNVLLSFPGILQPTYLVLCNHFLSSSRQLCDTASLFFYHLFIPTTDLVIIVKFYSAIPSIHTVECSKLEITSL